MGGILETQEPLRVGVAALDRMTGGGLRTPRAAGRPGGGVPFGVPRASFPDDGPGDGQRAEDGIPMFESQKSQLYTSIRQTYEAKLGEWKATELAKVVAEEDFAFPVTFGADSRTFVIHHGWSETALRTLVLPHRQDLPTCVGSF